jgi:D-serine deaminase-like pyridoxal phosphate-dependent protein
MKPPVAPSGPVASSAQIWQRYRAALGAEPLPAALVDLDAFERNIDRLLAVARASGKRVRFATKSVRCPDLVDRLVARAGDSAGGLMTYTADETAFWAERGHKDLLLAYPTVRASDLAALVAAQRAGAAAAVIVDEEAQLSALERAAEAAGVTLPFVIELDVSYRPVARVHLGVRRSPLRSVEAVVALAQRSKRYTHLTFHGLMAYEAQIAGLTDAGPFSPWENPIRRLIKLGSRKPVESTRADAVRALAAQGFQCKVVNGGGSGSLAWAVHEPALTDVTVGSGFAGSHLFSYYQDLSVEPAVYFALQVTRRPDEGIVTCHGGGYIASGRAGADRLPVPSLPEGLQLLPMEGAGEVQTPLGVPRGVNLSLGDPVFFRHAKAGELAEHFNEYLLVRGERVESRAKTYRGLGRCFLG